jgi:ribosomal protein S18 acetylase RimI-like enzyme
MTAVLTSQLTKTSNGLRPMDPMRDLRGVADLIEEAFANDLDHSGQNALKELRWLSRLKPILWWMVYSNPDHTDFLSGFVWEEDRKIVGNITVNRSGTGAQRWLISNLAVSEKYRQRGIARGLMYAALELVKEYNGRIVSLQVRQDNEPARRLYETLNFKAISGTVHLRADVVPRAKQLPIPLAVKLRDRQLDMADAKAAYDLACAATPLMVQKEWPIRQRYFRLNSSEHINNVFRKLWGGGASEHWVVEDGQRFVAVTHVQPGGWGKNHKIDLTVHPDWRGILEQPLLNRALIYLYQWPQRAIEARHPTYHPEAITAYKTLGFQETQTLLWMKKEM